MNLIVEFCIVFLICMAGEWIAALLPFTLPSVVGTLEYLDVLKLQFVPFLVVSLVSTPLVYAATAWSVRLLMKLFHAKEAAHD